MHAPNGLGLKLPDAHAGLLESYRAQTQGGMWHTVQPDGYAHNHLVWHMQESKRTDEIHALLAEETTDQYNGWYEIRERMGQLSGYTADLISAWHVAETEYSDKRSSSALDLQIRYALTLASVSSLAANIPPGLLVMLVEQEMLPALQAFTFVRYIPKSYDMVEELARLAWHLPATFYRPILAEVINLPSWDSTGSARGRQG